jgi:hypothetical protein
MVIDDRFATRMTSVEETPEPFRGALLERLSPHESIDLLTFNPSCTIHSIRSPATLLALTDRRWLLVSDDELDGLTVVECTYDDTLLVELTEILLFSQLRIAVAAGSTSQACVIEFDAVSGKLYREALRGILRRVERSVQTLPTGRPAAGPAIETLPILFRDAVPEVLVEGRRPIAAVQWPAAYGSYGQKLAPAAALMTTDRELVLISEHRTWMGWPRQAKYGYVATYFPLVRLVRFGFRRQERIIALDLDLRANHGGETFHILFPREREQDVAHVLECAVR